MADRNDVREFLGKINNPELSLNVIVLHHPPKAPVPFRSVGELALLVLDRLCVDQEDVER